MDDFQSKLRSLDNFDVFVQSSVDYAHGLAHRTLGDAVGLKYVDQIIMELESAHDKIMNETIAYYDQETDEVLGEATNLVARYDDAMMQAMRIITKQNAEIERLKASKPQRLTHDQVETALVMFCLGAYTTTEFIDLICGENDDDSAC